MSAGSRGTVVIGFGSAGGGDDAAGLLVARRMRVAAPDGVVVREMAGDGLDLIDAWDGYDRAIIVDAVVSGAGAGTIHRFDGRRLPGTPEIRHCSTHAVGLPEAILMAEALGTLPPRILVIGIEGRRFEAGAQVSPEVREAVERAARSLLEEIVAQGEAG